MAVIILLLLVAPHLVVASNLRVKFVGHPVEFTVPGSCADGKTLKLVVGVETVAQLDGGAWTGRGRFAQRIDESSGSSLILTDANVNDGGLFEFLCDGAVVGHRDSLKVVPLFSVRVTEGDTAILPAYTRTVRKRVMAATWSVNGTDVCSLIPANGTCRPGYNHRASEAPGGTDTGDFSLILPAVKREQGGNYTVCVEFESEDTECAAVSLEVSPVPTPTPPPKEDTSVWIAVLAVVAAAGWILFLVFLGLWLRSRRSPGPDAAGEHRNGEHRNGDIRLGLLSNGNPTRSSV